MCSLKELHRIRIRNVRLMVRCATCRWQGKSADILIKIKKEVLHGFTSGNMYSMRCTNSSR